VQVANSSHKLERLLESKEDWKSVNDLLCQQWFHRTWTLQEVAHATDAVLVCGNKSLPWKTFSLVMEECLHSGIALDTLTKDAILGVENVVEMNRIWGWSARYQGFLNVLLGVSGNGCTDPRDRIYALQTFAKERCLTKYDRWTGEECKCTWHRITDPSGNAEVSEVFTRFALWNMTSTGTPNFNCFSCTTEKSQSASSELKHLPSWVPDWADIQNKHPFIRYASHIPFAAGKGMSSNIELGSDLTKHDAKLGVAAVPIDCVDEVGQAPSFQKVPFFDQSLETLSFSIIQTRKWISECRSIAYQECESDPSKTDVFWGTMTCSLTGQGHSAPKTYAKHFARYCQFLDDVSVALDEESPTRCKELVSDYGADIAKIESSLQMWASKRKFARTQNGRLAFLPLHAKEGDTIAILPQAKVPYVFRLRDDGNYTVIGEAYVHGVMKGEAATSGRYDVHQFQVV
jgi:hypothetical protein